MAPFHLLRLEAEGIFSSAHCENLVKSGGGMTHKGALHDLALLEFLILKLPTLSLQKCIRCSRGSSTPALVPVEVSACVYLPT